MIKESNSSLGISTDELQVFFQLSHFVNLLLFGINQRHNIKENDIRKIILVKETSIPIIIMCVQHYSGDLACVLRKNKETKCKRTKKVKNN